MRARAQTRMWSTGFMFVAMLGACGGQPTEIATEQSATGETTTPPNQSTSAPPAVVTTTIAPDPAWPSFTIDPEARVTDAALSLKFASFDTQTIWLPSRMPIWLEDAEIGFVALPDNPRPTYWVNATIPYGKGRTIEVSSDIQFLYIAQIDDSPQEPETTIQGSARVYGTSREYASTEGKCGDVGILTWYEGNWRFSVSLTPGPGECSNGMESVQDAVAFADALVPCKAVADKLEC